MRVRKLCLSRRVGLTNEGAEEEEVTSDGQQSASVAKNGRETGSLSCAALLLLLLVFLCSLFVECAPRDASPVPHESKKSFPGLPSLEFGHPSFPTGCSGF